MPVWAFLFIAGQEDRAGCVGDYVSADAAEKKILEGLAAAAAHADEVCRLGFLFCQDGRFRGAEFKNRLD